MFKVEEIAKAKESVLKFDHRVNEAVNFVYGNRLSIATHGDSYLSKDGKTITHKYWDGNEDEPYDNCRIEIPFDWVNKSYGELKEVSRKLES